MAIARPAWPRVVIQAEAYNGTDGGPTMLGSTITASVSGGASLTNTQLCCLPVPDQLESAWWGDSPECEPDQDEYSVALKLAPLTSLSGVYLEIATSPEPIRPTDGADLFSQWNGTDGYSARVTIQTLFIEAGMQFLDLSPASATDLGYIRDNGLMFGFYEADYPDEDTALTLTLYPVLFDHYQFQIPTALLADTYGDPDLARPADDAAVTALMEDAPYPGEGVDSTGYIGTVSLDASDIVQSGYASMEVKPLELPSIAETTVSSELAAPDSTIWNRYAGNAIRLWKTVRTKLGEIRGMSWGGEVKSATQGRHTVQVVAITNMAQLLHSLFWGDAGGATSGKRIMNDTPPGGQDYNPGWAAHTPIIDVLWDCIMNSRHAAKYRDIYPDDWYWLRMRFEGVWASLDADAMIEAGWAGASYADVATWCMTMLGLFCGQSRNGNLLVWHPAVYRPSRRWYTLDLDADTTDGGTIATIDDWIGSVHLTGTDTSTTDHDDVMVAPADPAALEQEAGGVMLDIDVNNVDGECPVTVFDSEVCSNAILRQYVQRSGKCVLITGTVGKRSLLWDLGDLLTVSTARADTQTYMITKLIPQDDGASCQFEAVYFPNWPAVAEPFTQALAPLGVYRGVGGGTPSTGVIDSGTATNRTWRTDAYKLDDLSVIGAGTYLQDERLGSWEGVGFAANSYTTTYLEVACDRDIFSPTFINLEFSANYNADWGAAPVFVIWEWANSDDEGLILLVKKSGADLYTKLAYTTDVTDPLNDGLYIDESLWALTDPPTHGDYGERMIRITVGVLPTGAIILGVPTDPITISAASGSDWTIRWRSRSDGTYGVIAHSYMEIGPQCWYDSSGADFIFPLNGQDEMRYIP